MEPSEFPGLGAAIRAARLMHGWSQQYLGEQARVPQSHIAKIEAGKDVRASTLQRVASALGYDVSLQRRPIDETSLPPNSRLPRAREWGIDIASLYRSAQLSPAQRLRLAVDSANNFARLIRR